MVEEIMEGDQKFSAKWENGLVMNGWGKENVIDYAACSPEGDLRIFFGGL